VVDRERTKDIFEHIAGYSKPPLIPLPEPDDWGALEDLGLRSDGLSRGILKATMAVTGFRAFQEQLPNALEHLLRTTDLREGGLFAPTLAATLALEDDPRDLSPEERAAILLFAARSLYEDVMSGDLPPDEYRGQALEMGQYPNLFSTSLAVEGNRTRIFKSTNESRIIVAVARRLYALEVGTLGSETSIEQLVRTLEELAHRAEGNRLRADEPCPGLLTCGTTAAQRRAFRRLQRTESNAASLATLRHSFLTLCLDLDHNPSSYANAAFLAHVGNCANRWYHSSVQLVIFGNAKACVICNFSAYLDGNVMMRGASEIQKRAAAYPVGSQPRGGSVNSSPTTELRWTIGEGPMQQARRDLRSVQDNQQATFEIQDIGTDLFVAHGVKPVPGFILALQMATKRLTGKIVNIDQFLTMSKYRCMDVVTAMVTTPEVIRFVDHMERNRTQRERAMGLLREAVDSQIREARNVRRHLPFGVVLSLFIGSRKGIRRTLAFSVAGLAALLLRVLGLFKPIPRRQILVSHPSIYPEVPIVGRPGARLPYVRHFGLHYQMLEDRIVVTMMPGVDWTIPNAEFIAVLRESLDRIREVICGEG
jgi:hypothetical protein